MRILFVENHEIFASTVCRAFLPEHEVVVVPSLVEAGGAISVMCLSSFNAALVDYDLDDCKGDAVVRLLRERGFQGPIVAVSSHEIGNAKLLLSGADAPCPKMKFSSIAKVLDQAIAIRRKA
jgi:DNA-binding response OmpR family regulator